jgi:hypothetical protein
MTPLLTDHRAPLYRRVLGEAWDSLPAPLQTMHDVQSERSADGVAVVERGGGLLARLVAFVIGLPTAGADIPITVFFRARHGREYWQRQFAGRAFSSVQEEGRGRFERLLCERFGPINVGIALVCESDRLRLVIRRWSVCGIPMPRTPGATRKFVRVRTSRSLPFSRGDRSPLHRIDRPLSRLARPAGVQSFGGGGGGGDGPRQ